MKEQRWFKLNKVKLQNYKDRCYSNLAFFYLGSGRSYSGQTVLQGVISMHTLYYTLIQ